MGTAFVNCARCGREHLTDELTAIYAADEPAFTFCERCQGFCSLCGIELHEDWDILDDVHCYACEVVRGEYAYRRELHYDRDLLGPIFEEITNESQKASTEEKQPICQSS